MRENSDRKTLVILTGPTAVGKTETSISIARQLGAEIISADARQFYRELTIGTAAPTPEELNLVKHHLVGHLSIHDYYNASHFEQQAIEIADRLWKKSDYVVVTGGSGLYIDALCFGIDPMPDVPGQIRAEVKILYQLKGLEGLRDELKNCDPGYFAIVDQSNPNRMMRGIEMFRATGKPFSMWRSNSTTERPFNIKTIVLNRPRAELALRIGQRTSAMVQQGLIEEALAYYPHRHLNALNTVGFKELFDWLANRYDLATALEKIATNTRRYAKRQITWFKKYEDAKWFLPAETNQILQFIRS